MSSEAATTKQIEVPGADAPGCAGLRFSIPSKWTCSEVPLALFAVHPPDAIDGFWVHALVDVTKVSPHVDLAKVADATLARLSRHDPDVIVEMERTGRFGEHRVHLRGVAANLGTPRRRTAQLHALVLAPTTAARPVTDLVTLVGSCPIERSEEFIPCMIDLVASIEFLTVQP